MTRTNPQHPYDPWADLAARWPEVLVTLRPMAGRLLGELHYPSISLRASSTAAQRRCTLAHEIVHLDRGVTSCGPWAAREEAAVHSEAARRLISLADLVGAVRGLGSVTESGPLAAALEVDQETLAVRIAHLTSAERAEVRSTASRCSPRSA